MIRAGDVLHGRGIQSQQSSQVGLVPLLHHGVGPQGVHGAGGRAAERVLLQEGELCGGLVARVLLPPQRRRLRAALGLRGERWCHPVVALSSHCHVHRYQRHADVGGGRLGGFLEGGGAQLVGEGPLGEPSAVHVIHVVLELVLPLEGGGAVGAAEGPGVRMDHHVLGQRLFDAEALVALRTPVGLLAWREGAALVHR